MRIIKISTCAECPYLYKDAPAGDWCEKVNKYTDEVDISKKFPKFCPLAKLEKLK